MDVCVLDAGAYCDVGDNSALCEDWSPVCKLYRALFDLLSIDFSLVAGRDQAHAVLADLMVGTPILGRFPEGMFVNLHKSPYAETITSIMRCLDIQTRENEKLAKDGEKVSVDEWNFDDAVTSYYKGLKELNRLIYSAEGFTDRTIFEKRHGLIWA